MSRSRVEAIGISSDKASIYRVTSCQISSRFDRTKISLIAPVIFNSIVSKLPTQEKELSKEWAGRWRIL